MPRASYRRRHRHVFAWLVLGGCAVLAALLGLGLLNALGLTGALASAYFAIAQAALPAAWHDEFQALPGVVHVLIVVLGIGAVVGVLGELFD